MYYIEINKTKSNSATRKQKSNTDLNCQFYLFGPKWSLFSATRKHFPPLAHIKSLI